MNLLATLILTVALAGGFPPVDEGDSVVGISPGFCEEEGYPFLAKGYASGRVEVIIPQVEGLFIVVTEAGIFVSLPDGIKHYPDSLAFIQEYPGVGCQAGSLWLKPRGTEI